MRPSVLASMLVVLIACAPAASGQTTRSAAIAKPEHGFSLAVPSGWQAADDPDVAAAIARTDNRDVIAMVFVRREAKPTDITDTLAKALSAMKSSTEQTLVSNSFDVFLDRPALLAMYKDATARYRTVLVPREYEDRSAIYYAVTIAAPKAVFAKMTATFDRVFAGFQIVDLAPASPEAAPRQAPSPKAPASQSPSPKATALQGFDRAKVIERILAPQPIKPPLD